MNFTYKQLWLINYPVMMSLLMEQLINITDAVFLGHVGDIELGAAAIAGVYYLALYMLGFGFSLGLQVMIARRNGEKNNKETGKTFFQGLFFLICIALVICILSKLFSPYVIRGLVSSNEIYNAAISYIEWRVYGLLFAFPVLAFRSFFVGIIKTKVLTLNAIILITTNLFLNYSLIYGNFGFPELGIAGAAIASSLAELMSLIVLVTYTFFFLNRKNYNLYPKYEKTILFRLLRLSSWSMLHAFISVAPWFIFFTIIEHKGEQMLAIANIIRSISTVFFVIVNSFASTTGSLVSNIIGTGNKSHVMPTCNKIIKLCYITGIPLIILVVLFTDTVTGIYTTNIDLIQKSHIPVLVMLSNYFIAVPCYVYSNAVTGTGNTRICFYFLLATIAIYSCYLIFLNSFDNISVAAFWTAEHVFVLSLFLFSIIYMIKGKWKISVQQQTVI